MTFLVMHTFVLMLVFVAIGVGAGMLLRQATEARAAYAGAGNVLAPNTIPPTINDSPDFDTGSEVAADGVIDAETADDGIIDAEKAAAADQVGVRPEALPGPREGVADDLKRIRGIGPQNEARLNALGVYHLDQIAAWTGDEARWVGAYISFPGRVEREDWPGQARLVTTAE